MPTNRLLPDPNRQLRRHITLGQDEKPYPLFLYKYRTGNESFLDRIIVHSELYLSRRDDFNDPFDTRCEITYGGSGPEKRSRFQSVVAGQNIPMKRRAELWSHLLDDVKGKKLAQSSFDHVADSTGIHSLTKTPRSLLMWAHYGAEHKGICLQFYIPADFERFREALPVAYSGDFTSLNWLSDMDTGEAALRAFITKSTEWKYEEEYRLLQRLRARSSVDFLPGALVGVIYGARCPDETVKHVHGLIERRVASGKPRLFEWQARLSPRYFGVGIFSKGARVPPKWEGRPSTRSESAE
ncbi:DUF2971 domain-containing protein [Caballeronia sordidicola]|uniref:DUF2971 domain-containing protein n=1 Tax=Caballeronia sordidicola TaxID=196367 RepID=UPI000A37B1F7|nr:DUF2971 domain-containing protein [Caballeronia sordidicola]